jgi:UDP-N-acetylmuramate dehydrogenase
LGGGSNILVSDAGMRGLVIMNRAKGVKFRHTGAGVVCTAESGANLSSLARRCISKGLGGLEWAIGVPGTVGGAVVGNAGAHGGDMAANLLAATIWEPGRGVRIYTNEDMKYAYRDSILKREQGKQIWRRVVLTAELELKP